MTKDEVMLELSKFGNEQTKKIFTRHGAREPFYGVRYTMNGFVIAIGSYVEALNKKANEVAATIGKVSVDVGGTACKVPMATVYIKKVEDKGYLGKKRKSARC